MFFIGVFGIEEKHKEIRSVQNMVCKDCERMTTYELIEAYNFFHFFFVPIFKWNYRHYLKCRSCTAVFQIPKELGEALKMGENPPINNEDLNHVFKEDNSISVTRCNNCGREIECKFQYCPHCGHKL
ncbi:zinc ribbon domain-containing protein [Clostridium peptidivorans]|uniref:zinc ribbon domain-containing protein n=1 Tax=Clostridium peptidivorans TaxID=100174 RepID=UPI000BE27404|nr:zinc ribbon domain-containing protein [Clostridium peptidivorans]